MSKATKQQIFKWRLQGREVARDSTHEVGGREEFLAKMCQEGLLEQIEPHLYDVLETFEYFNERSQQWVRLIEGRKPFHRLPKFTAKEAKL